MGLRSTKVNNTTDRPSLLVGLRLVDKLGLPLDPSVAWLALKDAFKNHPHLEIHQATLSPDKEADGE